MRLRIIFALSIALLCLVGPTSPVAADDSMMSGGSFDSGAIATSGTFTWTFNDTGTFAYHCHFHPRMMGNVTVVDTAGANMTANVTIQGFAYSPANVTIAKGGMVTWTNMDRVSHTVTGGDAGSMHGGMMAHHRPMSEMYEDRDTFGKLSKDKQDRGLDRAEHGKLFGRLSYTNGQATGRFVSFGWNDSTGTITNFTHNVWNETIFSSVTIDHWSMDKAGEAHGAEFRAHGMDQMVGVHNNPTTALHFQTDENETNVTFHLGAGESINTNLSTDKAYVVTDAAGKYHGHVVLLGNATATNQTGAGGWIMVHLTGDGGVLYLSHPGGDTAGANGLHGLVAAASGGHLGTVLDVSDAGDGTPVEDELPLAAHAATSHLEKGKVQLTVSSDTSEGKTIVIHLSNDTIHAGDVTVNVSGTRFTAENITGKDAKAAVAALEAAGHGAVVSFADNGTEITIEIPHFSDQTVSIEQASADQTTTTPTGTTTGTPTSTSPTPEASKGAPGFELAIGVAALAGIAIVLRRR